MVCNETITDSELPTGTGYGIISDTHLQHDCDKQTELSSNSTTDIPHGFFAILSTCCGTTSAWSVFMNIMVIGTTFKSQVSYVTYVYHIIL